MPFGAEGLGVNAVNQRSMIGELYSGALGGTDDSLRIARKRALHLAWNMPYCQADPIVTARTLMEFAGNDIERWDILCSVASSCASAARAIERASRALEFINGQNPLEAPASA